MGTQDTIATPIFEVVSRFFNKKLLSCIYFLAYLILSLSDTFNIPVDIERYVFK